MTTSPGPTSGIVNVPSAAVVAVNGLPAASRHGLPFASVTPMTTPATPLSPPSRTPSASRSSKTRPDTSEGPDAGPHSVWNVWPGTIESASFWTRSPVAAAEIVSWIEFVKPICCAPRFVVCSCSKPTSSTVSFGTFCSGRTAKNTSAA